MAASLIAVVFVVSQGGAPDRQAALAPVNDADQAGVNTLVTDQNFNQRTARKFLLGFPLEGAEGSDAYSTDSSLEPASGSAEGPASAGGGSLAEADQSTPEPQTARAALGTTAGTTLSKRIDDCRRLEITPNTQERLEAVSYRVARYERQPAFLLVFRVPDAKPARLELWVLHQQTCRTLFFAQKSPD